MITQLCMVAKIHGISKEFPPKGKLGENHAEIVEICVFESSKARFHNGYSDTYMGEGNPQTGTCQVDSRENRITFTTGYYQDSRYRSSFWGDQFNVGQSEWGMMTFNGENR